MPDYPDTAVLEGIVNTHIHKLWILSITYGEKK